MLRPKADPKKPTSYKDRPSVPFTRGGRRTIFRAFRPARLGPSLLEELVRVEPQVGSAAPPGETICGETLFRDAGSPAFPPTFNWLPRALDCCLEKLLLFETAIVRVFPAPKIWCSAGGRGGPAALLRAVPGPLRRRVQQPSAKTLQGLGQPRWGRGELGRR